MPRWLAWLLALLTVVFLVLWLIKSNRLTWSVFKEHKESLEGASSLVGMLVLVIGGTVAYVKFAKGRKMWPKLDLALRVGVIPAPTGLLHSIEIDMKNLGLVVVQDYDVELEAHGDGTAHPHGLSVQWISPNKRKHAKSTKVIDVDESANEHAHCLVPTDISFVTYHLRVKHSSGTLWAKYLTVRNFVPKGDSASP